MKSANSVLSQFGTTIFEEMSRLAMAHGSINLGQGFPDEDGPLEIRKIAADALVEGPNQYPPMMGIASLRQAVAENNRRFLDIECDWQTEVLVTSGATEALTDCFLALIEPGDEVVMIEPLYDSYLPMVLRAGGIPRLVRIEPPTWELPRADLEQAFSDKTKLILLNSPHNPSGKVFSSDDLSFIAGLVEKYDTYAVCDEVYEHLVFDGARHQSLMNMPNMRDRCIRIGSAGKTFSMTGWKVGYITAAPVLLAIIAKAHQFVTFTTPPDLQWAVAAGLAKEDEYFAGLAASMQAKRDRFGAKLAAAGFDVLPCDGTYFLSVDFRTVGFDGDDVAFCQYITTDVGVTAVPVSAFYQESGPEHFARFCFCKQDDLLDEAAQLLKSHFT